MNAPEAPAKLLGFVATPTGRFVAVAVFTALMAVANTPAWPAVAVALALCSAIPSRRREVTAVAALAAAFVAPPVDLDVLAFLVQERGATGGILSLWPLVVAATLAFGAALVAAARRSPSSFVARRPVVVLLSLLTLLCVLAGPGLLGPDASTVAAAVAMALGSYAWFFAYAVVDTRSAAAAASWTLAGFWRPFWGFSNVPIGKGAAYLSRFEARSDEALAASQVAGLRLMLWGVGASLAMTAVGRALYTPEGLASLQLSAAIPAEGLPRVSAFLDLVAAGQAPPPATLWLSVLGEFVLSLLHMMAWGHPIVAICRMAGFHVAANTDRPLLSTSVAEFFNRFYFYFKELLATFFFYPAFLRTTGLPVRARLFAATFASAGAGNFLFHFFRDSPAILRFGPVEALLRYHVYAAYVVVLGTAVAVSQQRLQAAHGRRPAGPRRALATAGVLLFYALVNVLDVPTLHPLPVYLRLLLSLLGGIALA